MNAEFFLDTNVLIYTFDDKQPDKKAQARTLVESALESSCGIVSYQVVQEFINVATRKFSRPLSSKDAQRYLDEVLQPLCTVFASVELFRSAIRIQERWRYGFYDSLIVASALQAGCHTLYSEDLQHQQNIQSLAIVNPFL